MRICALCEVFAGPIHGFWLDYPIKSLWAMALVPNRASSFPPQKIYAKNGKTKGVGQ